MTTPMGAVWVLFDVHRCGLIADFGPDVTSEPERAQRVTSKDALDLANTFPGHILAVRQSPTPAACNLHESHPTIQ